MIASAARRAASDPIPPQTSTMAPLSKNLNQLPSYSRRLTGQCFTSGQTSRSSAATIATLGGDILIRSEPFHSAAEGIIHRDNFPAQFPLRFARGDKHFIPAHSHRFDSGPRFTAQNTAGYYLIDYASGQGHRIRHSDFGRRQSCDCSQLVKYLL